MTLKALCRVDTAAKVVTAAQEVDPITMSMATATVLLQDSAHRAAIMVREAMALMAPVQVQVAAILPLTEVVAPAHLTEAAMAIATEAAT